MEPVRLRDLITSTPLAVERERTLARAARTGDRNARAELIESSLRLVALRVRHLRIPDRDVDDAFQGGSIGLIGAIDGFDPERGVRLATYAWPWITAAIRSALSVPVEAGFARPQPELEPWVDLGAVIHELPARLAEVITLRFRIGEPADRPRTHADIACRLGLSVPQVRRAESQALRLLRRSLATLGDRDPL